jgi:hypothetical protein
MLKQMKLKLGKKKPVWDKPFSPRIAKRVKMVETAQMTMWVDQAMLDLGRALNNFGKTGDIVYLDEALVGAEAIHAMVNELSMRKQNPLKL